MSSAAAAAAGPIIETVGLTKHFHIGRGLLPGERKTVYAVDGVSLAIRPGETLGLVGESGCGKSTLARVVARIHQPTAGSVVFHGQDIANATQSTIRPLRRRMQMVFQDPYASLNPRMTVGDILSEPIRFHGLTDNARAIEMRWRCPPENSCG